MKTLTYKLTGQRIERTDDAKDIVRGSKNWLQLKFTFDSAWQGMAKVACFVRGNKIMAVAPILNNTCSVPDAVTDCPEVCFYVVGNGRQTTIQSGKAVFIQNG